MPTYPSAAPYLPHHPPPSAADARADASWSRRPGTGDADAEVAAVARPNTFLRSPKKLAIAGGALLLLVVVIVFATRGDKSASSSGSRTVASKTEQAAAKSTSTAAAAAPSTATERGAIDDRAAATPGRQKASQAVASSTGASMPAETTESPTDGDETTEPATTEAGATPTTTIEAKPAIARPKRFGGKRLVLEYDNQVRDTKPAPAAAPADQHAVAKARAAYNSGNQRLFAGDSAGAIRFYKESLVHYPGYVAGYRGLGLAYMQAGDKANALRSLRTYISSVPNAKDASLIRRRIKTLQAR